MVDPWRLAGFVLIASVLALAGLLHLRLGATLDVCARRYEHFCRRYRPEPKEQRRSRWGGWQLWREIEGGAARAGSQADLFGATGARYRGGPGQSRRAVPVVILRSGVLDEPPKHPWERDMVDELVKWPGYTAR